MNNIVIKPHKLVSKSEYPWGKIFQVFVGQQWYKWLVVYLQEDVVANNIATELLARPGNGQCLFFYLCISAFGVGYRARSICNWVPDVLFAWSSTAPSPNDEASADILA